MQEWGLWDLFCEHPRMFPWTQALALVCSTTSNRPLQGRLSWACQPQSLGSPCSSPVAEAPAVLHGGGLTKGSVLPGSKV